MPISVGGAGAPCNTTSPGPRLTSVLSGDLDPSNCLATIHQHYRQDSGPIAQGEPLLVKTGFVC